MKLAGHVIRRIEEDLGRRLSREARASIEEIMATTNEEPHRSWNVPVWLMASHRTHLALANAARGITTYPRCAGGWMH